MVRKSSNFLVVEIVAKEIIILGLLVKVWKIQSGVGVEEQLPQLLYVNLTNPENEILRRLFETITEFFLV